MYYLTEGKYMVKSIRLSNFFKHENLVGLVTIIAPENYQQELYSVYEHMDSDLHKIMNSNAVLNNRKIKLIAYQVLKGLHYMHSSGVVHGDLKPG